MKTTKKGNDNLLRSNACEIYLEDHEDLLFGFDHLH